MRSSVSLKSAPVALPKPEDEAVRLFIYARKKLLADGIPMQLKAVSYIRLCCAALQKIRLAVGEGQPERVLPSNPEDSYASLLARLCQLDADWCRQCWISDRGILKSDNPAIDNLLQPLAYFAETYAQPQLSARVLTLSTAFDLPYFSQQNLPLTAFLGEAS